MDLPNELKDQIIQPLDDKSRRQLRAVNTDWFNLVHYDHFKIYFATPKSLPNIVKQLMRYQWPIGLELLKTINVTSTHLEEQIYKLTQLTSLTCRIKPNDDDFNNKQINPKWLNLTNLQFLDLTETPIPVDLVYYCHNLTALRGVVVPNCSRDMREILFMNCTKLEFLRVDALRHVQDPKPPRMDHLDRLTHLIVNWAPPKEIVDVKTMTNLRELGGSDISGVDIGNLTTLEVLNVDERPIIGDISGNKNLTDLTLDLDENPSHVTALGSLNALQILHLSLTSDKTHADNNQALLLTPQSLTWLSVTLKGEFNYINIKNISHLTNLRMLDFCSPDAGQYEVTAEDFKHFSRLTSLTAGELFAATKYLPELREFRAMDDYSLSDGSNVDDFDPTCVPKLEHLLFLNPIPSRVFSKFTALRSLKTLTVYEQPNDVFDYNVLSYMALEDLTLRPNKLTREDWLALQKLTNLTSLRISDTEVTDDMTLLTRLTRLKDAEIENAKLEHWLPLTFLQRLASYPAPKISQQLLDENFPYLYQHGAYLIL